MKYSFAAFLIALATVLFVLMCTATAKAQNQQRTISETLDFWIANTEDHVMPLAEAMPEEKYSFAPPASLGEFNGVRTFGQMLKHLAANNYWEGALILGDKLTPEMYDETGPDTVRSKSEILKYLKGSFTYLHRAVATINEKNVVEHVPWETHGDSLQRTRLSFAVDAVAHCWDHFGQLVEYLRMNGIIPPASRKKQAAVKGAL